MVNEKDRKILSLLQSSSDPVSGETLSSVCGVSRVAVWKRIQHLNESGFSISGSPRGYVLNTCSYDLGKIDEAIGANHKRRIMYMGDTTSTMDYRGEDGETIVLAEHQSGGRGKRNRSWISERGGLYYTYTMESDISVDQIMKIMLAGVASVVQALRDEGVAALAKWPNDILVDKRKIGGVLVEFRGEYDWVKEIKTGFGINLNNSTEESSVVSLKELTGKECDRTDFLIRQFNYFRSHVKDRVRDGSVIPLWKSMNTTLGKTVRVADKKDTTKGQAFDLDERGALLVRGEDGSLLTVTSGDCVHIEEN